MPTPNPAPPSAEPTVPLRVPGAAVDALPRTQAQSSDATPLPVGPYPRVRGYDILSVVGIGGMGVVYEARHRELNRRVAIKTLRGGAVADPEYRGRFRAEAEAIARLQHPNVIQVFEVGTVEPAAGDSFPSPFLALEFVDGGCLAAKARAPQPPEYAARTVATLARAAFAAHQLGVIHRDLKPANVLLGRDGEPKVADFGIAKQVGPDGSGPLPLTRAGVVMGTPEYMAPEQLDGDDPTPAVDIYALGVILYELLTGRVPFHGATFAGTARLARTQEPVPPRRLQPAVPRDLETICLKCLEKAPGRRYATAAALADDLDRWAGGHPIHARPPGPLGRAARWARRNPTAAALSVAVLLVAAAGLTGVAWGWDDARWNEAQAKRHMGTARQNAERAEGEATKNREAAERERWERYRVSLMAASGGLRLHDTLTARRALDDAPPEHRDWVWRLLAAQLDRSRHVLGGPGDPIRHAHFSANGRWALARGPGGVTVWDLATRQKRGPFPAPPPPAHTVVSDDGETVAYTGPGPHVTLLDARTGATRALRGHAGEVRWVQLTPGDREVVSLADDRTARVWDVAAGHEVARFRAPDDALLPLVVSPDGRTVGSRWDGTTPPTFWELRTGRLVRAFAPTADPAFGYAFSPDGARVVQNSRHPVNTLKVWAVATGELLATLVGHDNHVTHTAFSPDGSKLASCSLDRTVRVWDVGPGAPGRDAEPRHVLEGHTGVVRRVTFSPDGQRLLSASDDRTLRYWNVKTGKPVAVLQGHAGVVSEGVFCTDRASGEGLIASHAFDDTVRVWGARAAEDDYALRGHESYAYCAAFFPGGDRVVSSGWDDTARVWDARTGKELRRLDHGGLGIVSSVAVRPGGTVIATLARKHADPDAPGGVRLWDADTGALLHTWRLDNSDYRDSRLAFSPDGALLAAGAPDRKVRVWDVDSRRQVALLEGHTAQIRDVAFSPDGTLLASVGEFGEGAARVWDVATGRQVAELKAAGNRDCLFAVAWHPDGKVLATGSQDGAVRLWDVATGELVGELKHGSEVYGLAFSPDGKLLATGAADNLIRLWHVGTQRAVAELSGHGTYVHTVAFDRAGTRLVSASGDKTVRVWDADPRRVGPGLSP